MDIVDKTVKEIKELKIQGAENIARAAIVAWSKAKDKKKAFEKLAKARPTEPMLRNALKYLEKFGDAEGLLKKLDEDRKKIEEIGSKKIQDGFIVYTHCHSSTVTSILKRAWKDGKKFEVHVTETRPFFQGRITAKELATEGIPVTIFVDSAARLALKKANIMMIGCDAITAEGIVINKIGSELFAEVANRYDVPVYVATHSLKFDPLTFFGFEVEIEKRATKEVWDRPPRGVKISNYVFEKINPKLITGIISELGVLKPETFIQEVKRVYRWLIE
ncbi:MAG: hypothetical protein LM587_01090 [Candidatus Aenigmarchaeota archaeon]|nr:hypothetical protein [Candidatus Aenigmarchaeota archaeon]